MADTDYWEALNKISELKGATATDVAQLLDHYSDKLSPKQFEHIIEVYRRSCMTKNSNGGNTTE